MAPQEFSGIHWPPTLGLQTLYEQRPLSCSRNEAAVSRLNDAARLSR